MTASFILYAPNVNTGGGLVLLRALLLAWPDGQVLTAFLDDRARTDLPVVNGVRAQWVRPSFRSRWQAERALRAASDADSTVLCFHSLPPVLPNPGRVVLFQQNRNYLGLNSLSPFGLKTGLRLGVERIVATVFRRRVAQYLVQTPSMARDLATWYGSAEVSIGLLPFIDELPAPTTSAEGAALPPTWDFIYASDGVAHKNHRNLLAAWRLLAEQGFKPTLALTLGPRDEALIETLQALQRETGVAIHNLGQLPRGRVLALYARSRALIFPSTLESFGLPLIEAQHLGIPILAPEADYVRDVCVPAETFDPLSPLSIARAVRRFLGQPEPMLRIGRPTDLWAALQSAPSSLRKN